MKWTLALAMCALLIGCANQTELAKQSLIKKVHSEYPVEFKNVASYPGNVSCGEYKALGKWGGGEKFRPFIVKAGEVDTHPLALDIKIFCSADPAESLYSTLGINPSNESEQIFLKVREDFHLLSAALEMFYQTNYRYPNMLEGLDALVVPGKYASKLGPLKNGGYLEKMPQDPWNRAYRYHLAGLAGVKREPDISTLGADGVIGGKDESADIKLRYLKYLDHIAGM